MVVPRHYWTWKRNAIKVPYCGTAKLHDKQTDWKPEIEGGEEERERVKERQRE